jgi:hypothetical protein
MGPFLESDRQIAALARRQDGVVRHDQLRELGLTQKAIRHRRDARWLIDLHWKVYAVGHDRLSANGRRLAAVWAYGPKAGLSHRAAAAAWNLRASGGGDIDVTVRARSAVQRSGTRLHLTSRAVEIDTELALTLSELEERFRGLCADHALPEPEVNARPLGFRVDFFWAAAGLVVETDGWQTHRTRAAFEEDRARDQALSLAGLRTVRFTYRQIVDGPEDVAAKLRSLLVQR